MRNAAARESNDRVRPDGRSKRCAHAFLKTPRTQQNCVELNGAQHSEIRQSD